MLDLFNDLRDGSRLLDLLEVMSDQRMVSVNLLIGGLTSWWQLLYVSIFYIFFIILKLKVLIIGLIKYTSTVYVIYLYPRFASESRERKGYVSA